MARVNMIACTPNCDTATLRGEAQYGLVRLLLMGHVCADAGIQLPVYLPMDIRCIVPSEDTENGLT